MKNKNLLIAKNSGIDFKNIFKLESITSSKPVIIAGPCSVEDENMLETIAKKLSGFGVRFLRGGVFKPRTSPYDFQGIGIDGLKILKRVSNKYNMRIVSEVTDTRYVEKMINYVDVLQIGSRNMQNFELLKEVGRTNHPILLKRGMSATINEFKMAAEYIALGGNKNIILCERGIRTFETETRNTLDISCIAVLQKETQLPIIVDISHSLGRKDIIENITKAVLAMGVDGIMVEVHNSPKNALSDSKQQLNFSEFERFMKVFSAYK